MFTDGLASGAYLQNSLHPMGMRAPPSAGRLLRAVVLATYVTDDPKNISNVPQSVPVAVYCDVLCYGAAAGSTPMLLPSCLVSQDRAGIQSGDIWRPRATSRDVTGAPLHLNTTNPMTMDGDHVLVGFMDDSLTSPVILRCLPHPRTDTGQDQAEPQDGQRVRLKLVDGSPDLRKHHGTVAGISDAGDFVVRTLYANRGELTPQGAPPAPPADATVGNMLVQLHAHAQRLTQLLDMTDPDAPAEALREVLTAAIWQLQFAAQSAHLLVADAQGKALEVTGSGGASRMTLGSGAVHPAVAENLETLYVALKAAFDSHTHATVNGPTGPPASMAPPWSPSILGGHLAFPAGS